MAEDNKQDVDPTAHLSAGGGKKKHKVSVMAPTDVFVVGGKEFTREPTELNETDLETVKKQADKRNIRLHIEEVK